MYYMAVIRNLKDIIFDFKKKTLCLPHYWTCVDRNQKCNIQEKYLWTAKPHVTIGNALTASWKCDSSVSSVYTGPTSTAVVFTSALGTMHQDMLQCLSKNVFDKECADSNVITFFCVGESSMLGWKCDTFPELKMNLRI